MNGNDTLRVCREMSDIARIVREAGADLEARACEAGRHIGKALATYNVDAGHDPAWLSRAAWATYYELMQAGFEQVNLALDLPPDAVG